MKFCKHVKRKNQFSNKEKLYKSVGDYIRLRILLWQEILV